MQPEDREALKELVDGILEHVGKLEETIRSHLVIRPKARISSPLLSWRLLTT